MRDSKCCSLTLYLCPETEPEKQTIGYAEEYFAILNYTKQA